MNKLTITIIIILITVTGLYLFYKEGTLPVDKTDQSSKIFVIGPGESLNQITNNLSKEGLIRNKLVFYLVVKRLGLEKKIQAGDFRLSPSMNVYQVANNLTHGTLDIWVTIIEGLRKEEIAQIFSQNIGIPETEFLKLANEGYLFPDTYLIPRQATPEAIIEILQTNFNRKFDLNLQNKSKLENLSVEEIIILASLIEREARFNDDRPLVASVILNRLKSGMKLDIDASVQYALGYQADEKSWWKKNLTQDDLEIDSPYNTYRIQGLPPTPISNPGLSAIEAVINAPQTDYMYYLSDKNGKIHYASTFEEHNANIRKYLQ